MGDHGGMGVSLEYKTSVLTERGEGREKMMMIKRRVFGYAADRSSFWSLSFYHGGDPACLPLYLFAV